MVGPGADRVVGGLGSDTVSGGFLHADGFTVDLRLGTATGGGTGAVGDTVVNVEHIDGTADDDVLIGDRHDNIIFAGPGNDDLHGGAGNDHLDGHADRDLADGGRGTDACLAERKDRCER
jgi:Ca2+-binding RTX toxin-like protein